MALTKRFCETAKVPGRYADGRRDGLYLTVSETGAKSWGQRITIRGKRRDLGLGSFRFLTLGDAREAAFENQKIARRGGDPKEARERGVPTFADAMESVISLHAPTWRDKDAPRVWRNSVATYAAGLATMRVDAITSADVLSVLVPLMGDKARTAERLRAIINAVMRWSMAQGYRIEDPMPTVRAALPKNGRKTAHHRTVAPDRIGEALATMRAVEAFPTIALAIEFVALTAVRSGEARGATWDEIDMDAKTWTVPAERMKAGREHRVPLSGRALEVLEAARPYGDGEGLVFPAPRGGTLAPNSLTRLVAKAGLADEMTIHGLRSSFRDWAAETGKARELAEAALAHTVGGVEGAYFRSDLFERRRALMGQWAAYLTGADAKVVALRA